MKTWILVANSGEARLLATDNLRVGKLVLAREFSHPESRKKAAELTTDRHGSYRTDTDGHGSYSSKSEPKEIEAENFALELVHELKLGLGQNQFEKLVLVVPAHFYGLMKKHFHAPDSLEVIHILKDYTNSDINELHARLKEHIFV